jgi:hypothetical protein
MSQNAVSHQNYATMFSCLLETLGCRDVAILVLCTKGVGVECVHLTIPRRAYIPRIRGATNEVLITDMLRGLRPSKCYIKVCIVPG